MSEPVLYELRGDVAWLTLNQPERRNALGDDLVRALLAHLRRASDDPAVRVIVLTGAGPAFCAGADLKGGGSGATHEDAADQNPFVQVMKIIWDGPKPVIGRVNGHAFGGGIGLAAACDITIASDAAAFAFSEVRVGVVPAMISVVCVPKLGIQNAMALFLTGERFTAARAAAIGLIHRAVPAAELDRAVDEVVGQIRLGGPNAIREAKQLIRRIPTLSLDEAFRWTARKSTELFTSEEAAEGMRAFVEKRKPRWAQ